MDAISDVVQLKEVYVFNSELPNVNKNGEVGEILYFYPEDESKDSQLKKVGLIQAIIKFASTFSNSSPCDALHTQKCRYVLSQPEGNGYWFVLVLTIPCITKNSPEGLVCYEYQNDQVQDQVFQSALLRIYQKFVLLHDTLDSIIKKKGVILLRMKLKKFMGVAINKLEINQNGVLEMYKGLQFFTMDRHTFLKIQCFINYLLITCTKIKYLLILQNEKLVWSGIGQSDIQAFYDYLVKDLLSDRIHSYENEIQPSYGVIFKRKSHITLNDSSIPKVNLDLLEESEAEGTQIQNHSSQNNEQSSNDIDADTTVKKRFHLITYKADHSYINLLIDDSEEFDDDLLGFLDSFLSLHFTPLAKELTISFNQFAQNVLSSNSPTSNSELISSSVKFIYFNSLNLAEKYTPGCQIDIDSYRVLADLKSDLSRMTENGEIVIKMISDTWIIAKVSNKREFFAIFNIKGVNILEIDEEMRKLTDAHLTNIFFQD